jgi:iron(III) transport system substrate-binding protein
MTNFHYMPDELKQKGAPIDSFPLQPVIGQVSGIAMLTKAPNPNAAVLLYDFMLNEGQALLAERGFVPTSSKIETSVNKNQIKFIDPGRALDMTDKWLKTWDEVVLKQARQQQ